jgi:hypothetical protein
MTDISNHDHHDLDLIASYASGEANPRAEALVASCPHCLAEYDLQHQVHRWLAAAPAVIMADHERAALRHRVTEQIDRVGMGDIGRRGRIRQPGPLMLRLGAAVAGLAVLAGVSGVLGRLNATNSGAFATTTAVAAESMLASGEDEDLNDATGAAGAPTAATAATLSAEAGAQSRTLPGGDAQTVRKEAQMLIDEGTQAQTNDERVAAPPCAEEIDGLTPRRWAESTLDGEPIVIIVVEGEEAPEALVYRLDGCELVDL